MKQISHYYFDEKNDHGFMYHAVTPQADNTELANSGKRRVMVKHGRGERPVVCVAEAGILTAGWVIGIEAI